MKNLKLVKERKQEVAEHPHDLRGFSNEEFLAASRIEVILVANHINFEVSQELLNSFSLMASELFDDAGRLLKVFRRRNAYSGSHKVDAIYLKGLADVIMSHQPEAELSLATVDGVSASMRDSSISGVLESVILDKCTSLQFEPKTLNVDEQIKSWGLTELGQQQSSELNHANNLLEFKLKKG